MLRCFVMLLAASALVPAPARAQTMPTDAYLNDEARDLVRLARHRLNAVDRRIEAYGTTARERFTVALRAGIAEKLAYRRETVTRIDWERDGPLRLEVLAMREVSPLFRADAEVPSDLSAELLRLAFDPADPQILLRIDTTSIRHPFAYGGELHYRFDTGSATTIQLPDGRSVRLRELRIIPRRRDPRLISGSFWLDTDSHAVVQAYFRLARAFDADQPTGQAGVSVGVQTEPDSGAARRRSISLADLPFLRPLRADVDFIAIEYGLWELQWWLPRLVAARGFVQVSRFRIPLTYERTYDEYTIRGDTSALAFTHSAAADSAASDSASAPCRARVRYVPTNDPARDSVRQATTDAERARRARYEDGRRVQRGDSAAVADCAHEVLITAAADSMLLHSTELPRSAYGDDVELITAADLRTITDRVRAIPDAPWNPEAPRIQWLWQGPGLIRYNRVEGIAPGARMQFDMGPAVLELEATIGLAELAPRGEVAFDRSGTRLHSRLGVYRRLDSTSASAATHGMFASLGALLLGRDDDDYYDALGAELLIRPPESRSQWYDIRLYAERQRAVEQNTDFSIAHLISSGRDFRPNFTADAADQVGAQLRLRAARGLNPAAPRIAGELTMAGETGDFSIFRPDARLRVGTPLLFDMYLDLEGAAGTVEGSVLPAQASWWLGGAATLRGYPASSLIGERYWRTRAELGRGIPAARLSLFTDAAWAGPRGRFGSDGALMSAGAGISLLDGLFRIDVAHGFTSPGGWRLHLHFAGMN